MAWGGGIKGVCGNVQSEVPASVGDQAFLQFISDPHGQPVAQLAVIQSIYHSKDLPSGKGQALWSFLLTFKVASYKKRVPSATSQDVSID